jgi:hypothetical protein
MASLFGLSPSASAQYCTSNLYSTGCTLDDRIDLFVFNTINNPTSNCPTGAYSDFTNLSTQVTQGTTYTVTIGAGPFQDQFFAVWIDLDNNQTFDASEQLYASTTGAAANQSLTGSITIPSNVTGGPKRLRVRGRWNTAIAAGDACTNFSFGETEDYTVNIGLPAANDAGIASIISPISGCGLSSNSAITVRIRNYGTASISGIPVSYRVNGGPISSEFYPGSIAAGLDTAFTFTATANLSVAGTYTITAWTALSGDTVIFNDSASRTVTTIPTLSSAAFPYFQNFEAGNGGWISSGTISSWALGTPAGQVINAAASGTNAYMTGLSSNYFNNELSFVTSPCLNMTSLTNPKIEVKVWWDSEFSWDGAQLQSSIDGGNSWTTVGAFGDPDNWYNDNSVNGLLPAGNQDGWSGAAGSFIPSGSGGWVTAKRNLTGLAGQANVRLRIVFGSDASVNNFDGFAFDDLFIGDPAANDVGAVALANPSASCGAYSNQSVSVTIKNFGSAAQSNFPVWYRVNGGTPSNTTFSGTIQPDSTATVTFPTQFNFTSSVTTTFSIDAWTALSTDGITANDTLSSVAVRNNQLPLDSVTFTGYTGANLPSITTGWTEANGTLPSGNSSDWTSNTFAFPNNNVANIWMGASGTPPQWLISPSFQGDVATVLDFSAAYADFGGGPASPMGADDSVAVMVSTDCGLNWTPVQVFTSANAPTNSLTRYLVGLNLTAGQVAKVAIVRFTGSNFGGDYFFVDNLQVRNLSGTDLSTVGLVSPTSGCNLTSSSPVTIRIRNFGSTSASNFQAGYRINGGTAVIETVTATVAPNSFLNYTFTQTGNFISTGPGNYLVDAWINVLNDGDVTNDSLLATTVVNIPSISTFPYIQNFDSGPAGWLSGGTNSTWALGTPAKTVINSAASGTNSWITNLSGNYLDDDNSFVTSPCFVMTSLTNPRAELKIWWDSEPGWDGAVLQTSINGGQTWQNVGSVGDPDNWYNDNSVDGLTFLNTNQDGWAGSNNSFTPSGSGGWLTAKRNLTGLAGQGSVLMRVVFGSDGSVNNFDGFAFDDFKVGDPSPNDLGVTTLVSPGPDCGAFGNNPITVAIKNFGSAPRSNFPVSYRINGGTAVTELVTSTVQPDSTLLFTFTAPFNFNSTVTTQYVFESWTSLLNDVDATNDSIEEVINSNFLPLPTVDFNGFNGNNLSTLFTGWSERSVSSTGSSNGSSWSSFTLAGNSVSGTWTGTSISGEDWMVSPGFLANASSVIEFDAAYGSFSGGPAFSPMGSDDSVCVMVSTNCGSTWTRVFTFTDANKPSNTGGNYIVNLGLTGSSTAIVGIVYFHGNQFGGDYFFVDNLTIRAQAAIDLGIIGTIGSTRGCALSASSSRDVVVRNLGTQAVNSYSINYIQNGTFTNGVTINTPIPGNSIDTVTVTGINLSAIQTHDLRFIVSASGDFITGNDSSNMVSIQNIAVQPNPVTTPVTVCAGSQAVLTATGSATISWYQNANLSGFIGSGNSVQSPPVSSTTTFYAANDIGFLANVGPVDNTFGVGSIFGIPVGQRLLFTVTQPITINSVAVYPASAGNIQITIKDAGSLSIVQQSAPFAVTGGNTKTVVPVGITLNPGTYAMEGDGSTATLFRNTAGASYPYSLGSAISITGNSFDPTYYYFFYDWVIGTGTGCPGVAPLTVTTGNIPPAPNFSFTVNQNSVSFTNLTNSGTTYSWAFGDGNTSTQVNPVHTYAAVGTYSAVLTASNSCQSNVLSAPQSVSITVLGLEQDALSSSVKVFPNPASGEIKIELNDKLRNGKENLRVDIITLQGQTMLTLDRVDTRNQFLTMDVSEMSNGIYFLRVTNGKELFINKLVIQH